MISDGLDDRIILHVLRQSDVVDAEVLVYAVLGYPCVVVGVRRLIRLSKGDIVEGLELCVRLDDRHSGISDGWEGAVDGREVFERLGF